MSQSVQNSEARPRFAVVVPAYNAVATLAETLDGMAAQEYSDWECIIVDDGSTDTTAELAASYAERDSRFRLIRQENTGTAGAYRTGIQNARAELLIICAADDFLLPPHLRVMDTFISQNPEYGIYSSNGEYLYDDTGARRVVYEAPEWQTVRSLSFEQVIHMCFYSVGVVFHKEVYELTGGHRLGVYTDDYDLWLRAMARGVRHIYTPEVLSVHRVSSFQQSANLTRLYESDIEVFENLLANEQLSPGEVEAVERSIEARRQQMEAPNVEAQMEQQARSLRGAVSRVVGEKRADRVMGLLHRASWVVRPLRRRLAALKGKKS